MGVKLPNQAAPGNGAVASRFRFNASGAPCLSCDAFERAHENSRRAH